MSRTLVTSALNYANGPIHFGHVIGAYLPADVYTRTLRQCGEEVLFVCGTDEYGVAITLGAEADGVPYEDYVARWHDEIAATYDRLGIRFDIFSGTSTCPQHAEFSTDFFRKLNGNGYLIKQTSEQLYSPTEERFLADRYVTGICPKCGYHEARGDECPRCGNWLDPLELGEPRSKVSGESLEKRSTTHWYLDLPKLRDKYVGAWFESKSWKPNVDAFVRQQLEDIRPRPITRDLSWGIPVPEEIAGDEEGKVLYVWFDAPIGYVSMTAELFAERGDPDGWKAWWKSEDTKLVHFIGKDNIPFHCVVFPSMLFGVEDDYVRPWQVPANEFYNLQGDKFSTSKGWTIPLTEFFEKYDPEITRFHLLASAPETADSEWRWEDFQKSANELADKIGNLATRVLRFVDKHFEGKIPPMADAHRAEYDTLLLTQCGDFGDPAEHVREFKFRRAAEQLLANATVGNVFVDQTAPWGLRKTDPERCASALRQCCEWIAKIARWSAPFMPGKAQALWEMVGGEGDVAQHGWPEAPQAGTWHELTDGRSLGEVRGLFD
ncbi:MAG: methionine--tRNA ligase, partial [Planctomycetota bacterium]